MGILEWAAVIDTVGTLVKMARRMGRGAVEGLARNPPGTPGPGQIEAGLTGVLVAALKEAFDRDSVRLEMERSQLDAERAASRSSCAPSSAARRPTGCWRSSNWSRS